MHGRKSVFTTIGATNHSKQQREINDFYATDPYAIDLLKKNFPIPKYIWEPACGTGNLAKRLSQLGHVVYASDIIDRGYGAQDDFLNNPTIPLIANQDDFGIITNPPYTLLTPFVLQALKILRDGQYLYLFLKTTALESRQRYEQIYKHTPPCNILQSIDRILCAKSDDFDTAKKTLGKGALAYAWFIWEKGNYTQTNLSWI